MALLTVAVMLLCIAETFIDAHPFEIVESSVQFFNDRHNERNNNPQEYSIQSRMIETIDNLSPKKPLEVIEKTYESLKPAAPETVQSDAEKKESDNAEIHHSAGIIVPSGESALTSQNQELAELYSYFSDDERFKEALAGQVKIRDIPIVSHKKEQPDTPVVVRQRNVTKDAINHHEFDPSDSIIFSENFKQSSSPINVSNKPILNFSDNEEQNWENEMLSYFDYLKRDIYNILNGIKNSANSVSDDNSNDLHESRSLPSRASTISRETPKSQSRSFESTHEENLNKVINFVEAHKIDNFSDKSLENAIKDLSQIIVEQMNQKRIENRDNIDTPSSIHESNLNIEKSPDFEADISKDYDYYYVYYDEDGNEYLPEHIDSHDKNKLISPSDEFTQNFLAKHTSQLSTMLLNILKRAAINENKQVTPTNLFSSNQSHISSNELNLIKINETNSSPESVNTSDNINSDKINFFSIIVVDSNVNDSNTDMFNTPSEDENKKIVSVPSDMDEPSVATIEDEGKETDVLNTSVEKRINMRYSTSNDSPHKGSISDGTFFRSTLFSPTVPKTTSSIAINNFDISSHAGKLTSKKHLSGSTGQTKPDLENIINDISAVADKAEALPTPLNGNSALETLAGAGAVALMAYGISYALPFAAAVPIVGRRSDTSEIMDASPNNPISNLVKWMRGRYGAQKRSYHGAPHPRLNRGGNTYPESNFGFDEYIEDFEPAFRHRRPNERQHQKDNFNNFNTYEFPAREETFSEDGFKFDFPEDDGRYGDDPTNEHKSMFGEVTYEYDFSNADVTPPSYDLYERNNEVNAKSTTARDLSPHKQTSGAPSYRPPKRPPMRYRGPSFRFPKLPKLKLPTLPPYQFPKLPTVEVPIPKRHHVADHVMDFVRDFRSRVPNHLVNQHRAPPKKPQPSYKPGPPAKPAPKPQGYRPPSSRAARPFGRRPMRHHASPKMDTEEDIIFAEGSSELPTYVSLEQINRLAEEEMEGVVKGYSRRYNAPWPPPSDQSTIIFESPEQDFRSDRLGEPAHESGEGGHPHGLDYSDFHYVDIRGSKDIIDEPEKSDNGEQIQQPGTSDFETKQFRRRNRNPSRQFQHKSINEATSSGFVPGGPPPSQRRDKKSVGKLEHQYRERENVQLQKPYWHS